MKLLRIKINSQFSSLSPGFELSFRPPYEKGDTDEDWRQFNPFCFAGLNGSGKSNVLEALSSIFFHLEGCANTNQPQNFKEQFYSSENNPDAYELEYYIKPQTNDGDYCIENMVLVNVTKETSQAPKMTWCPYPFLSKKVNNVDIIANKGGTIQAPGKNYLPDLVIGYSSGENEILSIPFLKARLIHFDEYKEAVRKKLKYEKPESNLIYIDYEMSQAVLLSNYLFQDKETVLKPLETELNIIDIKQFRMYLNISEKIDNIGILEQFDKTIQKFKRCATAQFENENELILDFWINDDTKRAFQNNFKAGIFELFQAFQILYTLNYHSISDSTKTEVYGSKGYYTHGKIHIPGPSDKIFYFLNYYIYKRKKRTKEIKKLLLKQLSDGEQQFLHSMGICLMLKNKSCLLLLDEPETHFNPDWRSEFIGILHKSLLASGSNNIMMDLLITSHSPFIISDCKPENVIVFDIDNNGEIIANTAQNLGISTYGTSVNLITNKIFKKKETIGKHSLQKINEFRARFKANENVELLIEEINEKLGDSIEKLMLIAELTNISKK